MWKLIYLVVLCVTINSYASAQEFDFAEAAVREPSALSKVISTLAEQVIGVYKDNSREQYLDNSFRLQMVAGHYANATQSLGSLSALRAAANPMLSSWANVQYKIYADARAKESKGELAFAQAYGKSFRDIVGRLDDKASALVIRALTEADLPMMRRDIESDLERQKGKSTISITDALKLIHDYQVEEAYRSFAPLTTILIQEDDHRRYIIDKDILVKTEDGSSICTLVVRSRIKSERLPTLLNFTIYADPNGTMSEARRTASNGYAGVEGLTRGKGCSPSKAIPYEYDGSDADTLIEWIIRQPWSNGQVGMYGGSYEGFAQWAAAKHIPNALKALMPGAPVAPGLDVPMEGNIFWNFTYPYPFYTTDSKYLDDATYNNSVRWNRLNHDWYVSGRAYRDLDKIDGTPNPIFDKWISHPSYDTYWQSMIPYGKEFGRINIPVLTTAGYFYGGPGAAVYYFNQHYRYAPKAEHYLVIGPYDHIRGHRGTIGVLGDAMTSLAGYELDPAAQIDFGELRYQWFDYVLKGGAKPALLQGRVNYEVMGANKWKHAPSLSAMGNQTLRFHLSTMRSGNDYCLSKQTLSKNSYIPITINLADRSDVDRNSPGGGVLDKAVDSWNGVKFVSDPLPAASEISGLFSARLDFTSNKKDFDFEIDLYELKTNGDYIQLAPYWARASYVRNHSHRRLLASGKRQQLDFRSARLMSCQLEAGSRLVMVLLVVREPGRQVNYGTGEDVSDETVQDARVPLEIKWYSDSYLDLPVWK